MRFALVNGIRSEAQPKRRGKCPCCRSGVIAKCGRFKIWHWSHERREDCDSWSEPETEWHRSWKNEFPAEWQEVVHIDSDGGERHIADVKTEHGLVIEFQHSSIAKEEMQCREAFYKRLIWIVDGQPEHDSTNAYYFRMGLEKLISADPKAYRVRWYGQGRLLHKWAEPKTDVYLDFGRTRITTQDFLWRLMAFDQGKKEGIVVPIAREELIENCRNSASVLGTSTEKNKILQQIRRAYDEENREEQESRRRTNGKEGQLSLL